VTGLTLPLRLRLAAAFACAFLAAIAYGPAQFLPFIGDDYLQIHLGRRYGSLTGWSELASDALYRCRATSIIATNWTEQTFGIHPFFFNLSSLSVHILNCLLLIALGIWRPVGWRVATVAAIFFSFLERPHEAVIWYAALPELLVFTFTLLTFVFWIRWLQAEETSGLLYITAIGTFVLALASKESAVCVTGLIVLATALEPSAARRHWCGIIPFALLSIVYFLTIYQARSNHLHFNDGTFSLAAPFGSTLLHTAGRMFWPWGFAGVITLLALARLRARFSIALAGWLVITLLPYSFLTYMSLAPSRHTYLANVAVALVLGAATLAAWRWTYHRRLRSMLVVPLVVCFIQNTSYLWTKKQHQFALRAQPTQEVLRAIDENEGVVELVCFPHEPLLAKLAVEIERPAAATRILIHGRGPCKDDAVILRPVAPARLRQTVGQD
jgi:hypothetical protein